MASGVVIIEAHIGRNGRVIAARVIRGNPLFDEAALEAVRQFEYAPPRHGADPIEVWLTATITFQAPK